MDTPHVDQCEAGPRRNDRYRHPFHRGPHELIPPQRSRHAPSGHGFAHAPAPLSRAAHGMRRTPPAARSSPCGPGRLH